MHEKDYLLRERKRMTEFELMGLMGLMGTNVFKSQRTDGAASGESCLHELSRVVTSEDDCQRMEQ